MDWIAVLKPYSKANLSRMWQHLCPRKPIPRRRDALLAALARAVSAEELMHDRYRETSQSERMAMRIVNDAAGREVSAQIVQLELRRLGRMTEEGAEELIIDLILKGFLVGSPSRTSMDRIALNGHSVSRVRLLLNPVVESLVAKMALPGETIQWSKLTGPIAGATTLIEVTPEQVIEPGSVVVKVVDAQPLLLTSKGAFRAAAERKISQLTSMQLDDFAAWLTLADRLGVVQADADGFQRWRRGALASKLTTEPLAVLCRLPAALRTVSPLFLWDSPGARRTYHNLKYKVLGELEHLSVWITGGLLDGLTSLAQSPWDRDAWMTDHLFLPVVRQVLRIWNTRNADLFGGLWYYSYQHLAEAEDMGGLVCTVLDALATAGLIVRVRKGKEHASRLTEIGAWVLRHGEAYRKRPFGLVGLHAPLAWEGDRLLVGDPRDTATVTLALGSLGKADGRQSFCVDKSTITATLEAGELPDEVRGRLDGLTPQPVPSAIVEAVDSLGAVWQPLVIRSGQDAIEVSDVSNTLRDELVALGCEQIGDLFLVPTESTGDAIDRIGPVHVMQVDYDVAPSRSCTLDADLDLKVMKKGPRDLRLEQLLEDLNAPPRASSVRLDPDQVPGADGLDDRTLDRHLQGLLRRIDPFLRGGVTDEVRVCFLGQAGTVAAPTVEDCVLLTLDERIAKGIAGLGVVGAELLEGGRLLVTKQDLPRVEEQLSELGIPFPAEHSTLREVARARAAVGRLEQAVASAKPASAKEPATPAGTPSSRRGRRRKTQDPAMQESIMTALHRHSLEGGRGATLGELAEATGQPREQLRPVLRQLVKEGVLHLTGHARGARYRLC